MSSPNTVTNAELSILDFLWESGPATKRAIADSVYPGGGESELATIHKLLQRLEAKGHVRRDRSSVAHIFSAAHPKAAFIGQQLRDVAKKLSGGSLTPLVMQLVEANQLTKQERAELRALLDD